MKEEPTTEQLLAAWSAYSEALHAACVALRSLGLADEETWTRAADAAQAIAVECWRCAGRAAARAT